MKKTQLVYSPPTTISLQDNSRNIMQHPEANSLQNQQTLLEVGNTQRKITTIYKHFQL